MKKYNCEKFDASIPTTTQEIMQKEITHSVFNLLLEKGSSISLDNIVTIEAFTELYEQNEEKFKNMLIHKIYPMLKEKVPNIEDIYY